MDNFYYMSEPPQEMNPSAKNSNLFKFQNGFIRVNDQWTVECQGPGRIERVELKVNPEKVKTLYKITISPLVKGINS